MLFLYIAHASVQDDLPRVVVLITGTPSADPVVEAAKYARDREIFIIGVGPEGMRKEVNNITGNPQRTITYSNPDRLSAKIPELRAKICSVDSQGTDHLPFTLTLLTESQSGPRMEPSAPQCLLFCLPLL